MSHFTKLEKTNIVSKEAFKLACEELGMKVVGEMEIEDYYGGKMTVQIAAHTADKYYIGLAKRDDGKYDMIADWWAVRDRLTPQMKKALDGCNSEEDVQNLILKYTNKHHIINTYRKKGYRVNVREGNEQNFEITMTKAS